MPCRMRWHTVVPADYWARTMSAAFRPHNECRVSFVTSVPCRLNWHMVSNHALHGVTILVGETIMLLCYITLCFVSVCFGRVVVFLATLPAVVSALSRAHVFGHAKCHFRRRHRVLLSYLRTLPWPRGFALVSFPEALFGLAFVVIFPGAFARPFARMFLLTASHAIGARDCCRLQTLFLDDGASI